MACGFYRAVDKIARCSLSSSQKNCLAGLRWCSRCRPPVFFPPQPRRIILRALGRWNKGFLRTRLLPWCRHTTAICGLAPTMDWRGSMACASRFSMIKTRRNCTIAASRVCLKRLTEPSGLARKAATFRDSRTDTFLPCLCAPTGVTEKFTPSPPTMPATFG